MTPEQFEALEECVRITERVAVRLAEAGRLELAAESAALAAQDRRDLEALRAWHGRV